MADVELRPDESRRRYLPDWLAMPAWWRPVWAILHDSFDGLVRHDGIMVASAIAFSLIFALFPFLLFLVSLGAMIGGADLSTYISREALAALVIYLASDASAFMTGSVLTINGGQYMANG